MYSPPPCATGEPGPGKFTKAAGFLLYCLWEGRMAQELGVDTLESGLNPRISCVTLGK